MVLLYLCYEAQPSHNQLLVCWGDLSIFFQFKSWFSCHFVERMSVSSHPSPDWAELVLECVVFLSNSPDCFSARNNLLLLPCVCHLMKIAWINRSFSTAYLHVFVLVVFCSILPLAIWLETFQIFYVSHFCCHCDSLAYILLFQQIRSMIESSSLLLILFARYSLQWVPLSPPVTVDFCLKLHCPLKKQTKKKQAKKAHFHVVALARWKHKSNIKVKKWTTKTLYK